MKKDSVFEKPLESQFTFNEEVVSVFDDMIERSVPFYRQMISLSSYFVRQNISEGGRVYDLGSSTGNTLFLIEKESDKKLELLGLDSSQAMVELSQKKASALNSSVQFVEGDVLECDFLETDAFISNFTLQFIRPLARERFVKKIYDALKPGGIFILSEKLTSEDQKLSKQMIELYHAHKKEQGYSEYEIAKKREALENVLVPYTQEENVAMLKEAGFKSVEVLFRWVNFATFFARK